MMNAISKIIAILLAAILLYLVPTYTSFQRQEDISQLIAQQAVVTFVDAARNKGYISPTMYHDFQNMLRSSGNDYKVEMVHSRKRYDPIYSDSNVFQNDIQVSYDEFIEQDILKILFPENTLPDDDERRMYKMRVGDFFKVTITNINKTNATTMKEFLTGTHVGDVATIVIPYGGMVYNEDH